VLRVISSSPTNVQPVFEAIAERSMVLCDAQWGVTTRFDGDLIHLGAIQASSDQVKAAVRGAFPMKPGPRLMIARAILEAAPAQSADVHSNPDYDDSIQAAMRDDGIHSVLAVPMLCDGQVVGSIGVARAQPGVVPDKLVRLLQTFAEQAVIAIENVRKSNETREALETQTAIAEILKVISTSPSYLAPVFDTIAEHAMVLCEANFGMVTRFDGELVHLAALKGASEESVEPIRAVFPMPAGRGGANARAIAECAPVQVKDSLQEEGFDAAIVDAVRRGAPRSALAVPMLLDGKAVGSIAVSRTEVGLFSERTISLLETFAAQAVIAIENARLINETRKALERQTAISDILRVISESPTDVQPVFDAIAQRARALCNARIGVAVRFDGELMHAPSFFGLAPAAVEALRAAFPMKPERGTLSGRAIQERRTIQIPDLRADPEYAMPEFAQETRSALTVPLMREGQVLGALSIARAAPGAFPDKLVSLLETFAGQAVIAIENVRLFNETQEALEQQTAISEILRVISESPTDVQPVFDIIAERAMALCGAEMGITTRFDGELIHSAANPGMTPETAQITRAAFPMKPNRSSLSGRVVLEGAPVQIPDMLADPEYLMHAAAQEARSGLAVPLMRDGRVLGTLMVARKQTGLYPDNQIELLKTFAGQAVIAIENVRLFNETQEALEQQTAISEILRVISESPTDVQPVFEAITERAMALCNAEMGAATRFDGEQMHIAAIREMTEAAREEAHAMFPMPPTRATLNGRCVLARAPVQIPDSSADAEFSLAAGARAWSSALAVPLMRDGRVLGALMVARKRTGVFADKLVSLLRTFADQAVIAVENVRLFNETREALEQQTATAEVLRVISSSVADTAPVFEKILDSCERLFDSDRLAILLVDDDGIADIAAFRGKDEQEVRAEFPRPSEQTAAPIAFAAGTTVHYPDVDALDDPPLVMRDTSTRTGNFSFAAAPMLWEGRGIGVISLMRQPPRAFSDKEIALLGTFADQAVIAIQNARLFNETREALEQQTATAEVLRVISGSVADTAPVFEKILDSCAHLFATEELGILLVDGDLVRMAAYRGEAVEAVTKTFPRPLGETATAEAILKRKTVHYPSVSHGDDVPSTLIDLTEHMGDFSIALAPMLWEEEGVGTILMVRTPPDPFSDKELALLSTFADQAVIAIQNARLFNETKEALEQQTATAEVLSVISSSVSDTAPVFEKILDSCEGLFATEQLAILLVGEDGLMHAGGIRGSQIEAASDLYPMPLEHTMSSVALRERRVVHIPDVSTVDDAPRGFRRVYENIGNFSYVTAPMLWEGRGVGSINLIRQPPKAFTAKEIALLTTFADQAVIAIQNARLFNETKEALEQQTATAEVLRVISSSVADTTPVFEKILDSCERLFEADQLAVILVGDDGLAHAGALRGPLVQDGSDMFPMPLDQTFTAVALRERRLIHIPDVSKLDNMLPVYRVAYDRLGNYSSLIAPMLWEGRGVGSVVIIRQPVRPFTDKEMELFTTFADQAVIAIENARLFHEIEDKSRQLEIADQHKSEFLANMSHELRTPLNAIIGFSEVLIERMFGELNEKQDDYLKDIYSSGKHLLALINDILDLSKIEAGRMELELETFDVADALANSLTLIRERAQQHGIALELDTPTELGEMCADQRKLKQIMLNLLSNAVKFTPDGGRIDVGATFVDDVLEVSVADTGIGIAATDQETVFQEFRQVGGNYTNKQEGTGLGLALTKRFVELHGGTIGLASEPGQGSTFTFTLPRQA
jgi:GAF domain-containing protein/anti-sigma regulatory factor (Ser/Thr protein kinase)